MNDMLILLQQVNNVEIKKLYMDWIQYVFTKTVLRYGFKKLNSDVKVISDHSTLNTNTESKLVQSQQYLEEIKPIVQSLGEKGQLQWQYSIDNARIGNRAYHQIMLSELKKDQWTMTASIPPENSVIEEICKYDLQTLQSNFQQVSNLVSTLNIPCRNEHKFIRMKGCTKNSKCIRNGNTKTIMDRTTTKD